MTVCFLCKKKEKLKPFCDKTFQKCCDAIQLRKSRGIKYGHLILTVDNRHEYGYHLVCYKKVTALKRVYQEVSPTPKEATASSTDEVSNSEAQRGTQTESATRSEAANILLGPEPQEHSGMDLVLSRPGTQEVQAESVNVFDKDNAILNQIPCDGVQIDTALSRPGTQEEQAESVNIFDKDNAIRNQIPCDGVQIDTASSSSAVTFETLEMQEMSPGGVDSLDVHKIPAGVDMPQDGAIVTMDRDSLKELADNRVGVALVEDPKPSTESSHQQKKNKICIFCNQRTKRVGSRKQFVVESTDVTLESIKTTALELDDYDICEKIENSERFYYHTACKIAYRKNMQMARDILNDHSDWYAKRQVHAEAFEVLRTYIQQEVLDGGKILYLTDLLLRYKAILYEIAEENIYGQTKLSFENYKAHHLQVKLLKTFLDSIVIRSSAGPLMRKIVYKKTIDQQTLIDQSISNEEDISEAVRNIAFEVRKSVKLTKKKKLPENLHPDAINEGECEISELLHNFVSSLVQGPDIRRQISDADEIKIKAVCQDLIYIIYKGHVKPAKHLKLGLAVKSLTNSRKVLNLLNKFGHSLSYAVVESLETELTYSAVEKNQLIPSGIRAEKGHSTHLAFDNYDRYVETRTGKDTLHDTVGIIYQFSSEADSPLMDITNINKSDLDKPSMCERRRRRKRFEQLPQDIEPYLKKPKASTSLTPLEKISNHCTENAKKIAEVRDLLWAFSMSRLPIETPSWIGYNSSLCNDKSEMQTIDYLPQINLSPTSYTVVNETLSIAEKIREECEQDHIIATYDLAIAKMAQQIQITESPKYDKIFINLGAFHIQMAFFKALGKFIDCSGLENILTESEILAQGSVNSFLSGSHFNRCKRIHPLILAALRSLHFETFVCKSDLNVTQIDDMLKEVMTNETEDRTAPVIPRLLEYYIEEYIKYETKTLNGEHGKTAQFYAQYMEFTSIFLKFSRAIRSRQLDLYMGSLFEMADVFFAFNHQNYARWLLKHHSDLMEMRENTPELVMEFERGAFGIKRKQINFSRSPVDLTLEQTINANAGNKLTGLIHLTSSTGARQRWALSHSVRTKIITQLIDDLNINSHVDVASDLRKHNMKSNEKSFSALVHCIKQHLNPFSAEIDTEHLFNISSGRAAKEETAAFLLNSKKMGAEQKVTFIKECNEDQNRFEKPIKRNKILNFASECAKKAQSDRVTSTVAQIKMERDIFGRLLGIAMEKKVNIDEVMSHPLAPVPPALAQYNGDMCKTDKAKLANYLKSKIQLTAAPSEDVLLIDGFFFLRTLGPLPLSFGETSAFILKKMCKTEAKQIHLILDKYVQPSIKDHERGKRNTEDTPYQITGPNQKRPHHDMVKSLNNIKFKEALIRFLVTDWEQDAIIPIIGDKKIYITEGDKCFSFENINNKIVKKEELHFFCTHEEADTRIVFHLSKIETEAKVLIKCSDTDILVIILGNIHMLNCSQIWVTNRQRESSFNCNELAAKLGENLCQAMPALHAFTGCDYTSAFKGKGKIKALQILESSVDFQAGFSSLNSPEDVNDKKKMKMIQKFVCKLYNSPRHDVNEARLDTFNKKYGNIASKSKLIKKFINFNASTLPPCWKSLKQHVLRTLFVTSMWLNATNEKSVVYKPDECGWKLIENIYQIYWYEGDPTPLNASDVIINEETESDVDICLSESSDESDS